jgi:HAD superfamily hydrolase (TIGR01490 family)
VDSNPGAPGLLERASDFLEAVLQINPRLAVFDCDGTLWAGDTGQEFFYWEIARGLIPPDVARRALPRYAQYLAGGVSEEEICGEMVTIHQGLAESEVDHAARRFFAEKIQGRIFPEMRELVGRLRESGCELWLVSSTNEWVVRASARHLGIRDDRVLAASVKVEEGCVTDDLVRVPTGAEKGRAIREVIERPIDVAFGNSIHDAAMLALARHAFAVNPSPELASLASESGWSVYLPGDCA